MIESPLDDIENFVLDHSRLIADSDDDVSLSELCHIQNHIDSRRPLGRNNRQKTENNRDSVMRCKCGSSSRLVGELLPPEESRHIVGEGRLPRERLAA